MPSSTLREGCLEKARCQARPRFPEAPRCIFSCFIGEEIKLHFIITATSVKSERLDSALPAAATILLIISLAKPQIAAVHLFAGLLFPLPKTARWQKGSSVPSTLALWPLHAPQLRPASPGWKEKQQKCRHFQDPTPKPLLLLPGAGIAPTSCQGVAVAEP